MTVALVQPTPSMDRSPRGWQIRPSDKLEARDVLLATYATWADAIAAQETAVIVHDAMDDPVRVALAAYRTVDAEAHEARRVLERTARDLYLAQVGPAKTAYEAAARVQRETVLGALGLSNSRKEPAE